MPIRLDFSPAAQKRNPAHIAWHPVPDTTPPLWEALHQRGANYVRAQQALMADGTWSKATWHTPEGRGTTGWQKGLVHTIEAWIRNRPLVKTPHP